ncbi:hypothetical protein NIES4071_04010 [Calothrix sp. NIES-4071]|nr:hypothetical protein NIES4071_04010 [Calothrix sp. NIES-4071]BAZ54747.1 hypothetical protein NIES4105_04000 [Calothrix sp. NIES-4105]
MLSGSGDKDYLQSRGISDISLVINQKGEVILTAATAVNTSDNSWLC